MTYRVTLDKKDIMFFCAILEAAERFAIVRTIDSSRPVIEVIASPDYVREIEELFGLIRRTMEFAILEVCDENA